MSSFQPIQQERPVAVRIAEQILERIRTGAVPVGAKLPGEVELSRQFGVSRPTIREALGALQFAGYVDSVRGSGTRVVGQPSDLAAAPPRDLGVAGILELLEARLVLEPQVAALAAMDPDEKALKVAGALVHGMDLVVDEPSIHAQTDLRVHAAIAKVCRNSLITDATLRLLDLAAAPNLSTARNRAWSDADLPHVWAAHHHSVLRAIEHRDPAAAADACWQHLASAATNVFAALGDQVPVERAAISHLENFISHGPARGVARFGEHRSRSDTKSPRRKGGPRS